MLLVKNIRQKPGIYQNIRLSLRTTEYLTRNMGGFCAASSRRDGRYQIRIGGGYAWMGGAYECSALRPAFLHMNNLDWTLYQPSINRVKVIARFFSRPLNPQKSTICRKKAIKPDISRNILSSFLQALQIIPFSRSAEI